jgi:hypothetical protein
MPNIAVWQEIVTDFTLAPRSFGVDVLKHSRLFVAAAKSVIGSDWRAVGESATSSGMVSFR